MSKIKAPFTTAQVDALNNFQRRLGFVHPFTCGHDHPGDRDLVATKDGWICCHCDYRQDWAHEAMLHISVEHHPFGRSITDATADVIDEFAKRCAKGNNGGEWADHYTEEQKNVWRTFVRDLIGSLPSQPEIAKLRAAIQTARGCFAAAEYEGLSQVLAETADERLRDLLVRRVLRADEALAETGLEPSHD